MIVPMERWRARLLVFVAATGIGAAGVPASAAAQSGCDDPPTRAPLEITPAVGASGVTLGAPIKVRYPDGYFEDPLIGADPLTSIEVTLDGAPWPGAIHVIGDTLVYIPDPPFEPSVEYEGVATGIDAVLPFHFRTGRTFDLGPPVLGEITSLSSARVDAPTCEVPDGGYRIDVTFEAATDDGPPGDIEYLLYLTRGPEVDQPELETRVRNLSPGEVVMAFLVPAAEVAAPICVSVIAVDGVGNVDDDGRPYCDDPVKGNFFAPLCSATPGRGPFEAGGTACVSLALLVLFARRRLRTR